MTNTPHIRPHARRSRLVWLALCLACAVSLVAGLSSVATADAAPLAKMRITVLSKSPATPVAGQTFTITFAVTKLGARFPYKEFGCLGMLAGRPLPVQQSGDGTVASCSWAIPDTAAGKYFGGIAVVIMPDGSRKFLGYDYTVS